MNGGLSQARLAGLVFLLISGFFGWQALGIASLPIDAEEAMSARTLPLALAVVGCALAVAQILLGGAATATARVASRDAWLAGLLLSFTVLYALALSRIGFLVATAVFLLAGFVLLGERRPLIAGGVAVVASLVFYALLRFGLGVYLAPGTWWQALGLSGV